MKTWAHIKTLQAERMSKRLAKHWEHKFPVQHAEQAFDIHMPDALVRLSPSAQELVVEISPKETSVDVIFLQKVVIEHLERMGHESLEVTWQSET